MWILSVCLFFLYTQLCTNVKHAFVFSVLLFFVCISFLPFVNVSNDMVDFVEGLL